MGQRGSGVGPALLGIVVGLVFIVMPVAAGEMLSWLSQALLIGFGVIALLVGSTILIITRLYRKTAANEAFVRTGMGGTKVIIDGGALVLPVVHNITPVMLETVRLDVDRTGEHSLICGDRLRADVIANFYIKVQKEADDVLAAATSLGDKTQEPTRLLSVVSNKLESALRDIAATRSLHDLNTKRDEFAAAVQALVAKELAPNGLTLETVTITRLDQTDPKHLRPNDNVFDAEGIKTIAEITNRARVDRNKIEREADQTVKKQDVERDQFVFQQEVAQEQARAEMDASKQKATAAAVQEAATFKSQQDQLAGIAAATADREVQLAKVATLQAADVAEQERQKAVQVAQVMAVQAKEVADRARQAAIANAEKARAIAETERLKAEAERETAAQSVKTVEQKATAEWARDVAIIGKEADARQKAIEENTQADIAAYAVTRQATAAQEAADQKATARLTLATAERDASLVEAEGAKAVQLVPVQVADQQVTVDGRRLELQEQYGKAALDLQIRLAEIAATKDAKIAAAHAFGEALGKANLTLWGDPAAVSRLSEAFIQGQQTGMLLQGVTASIPTELRDTIRTAAIALTGLATKIAQPNGPVA